MTRISSLASNTVLLETIFNTQSRVLEREIQVSSEKKSQNYQGIARDSRRLVNLENSRAQLDRFVQNNDQMDVRLEITEKVVENMRTTISDFRKDLLAYSSGEKNDQSRVSDIQTKAFSALKTIQNLLNTDVDGRFIFGGSRHDQEPVDLGLTTIAAFQSKYDGSRITYPTTRDAHLESFTINKDTNSENKKHITETNFLQFRQDSDGDTTTSGSGTIEASSAMFSNVSVGTYITVANTTNNNGTYTVSAVSSDGRTVTVNTEMLTDETGAPNVVISYKDPTNPKSTLSISDAEFGPLTFSRSGDTITATTANGLSALQVGAEIVVTNSTRNNGTYTVSANTGTVVTIEAKKLTDEGTTSANSAAATFFSTTTDSHISFVSASRTITINQNDDATAIPDIFNGLAVGNQVTIAGSASNNGTFTITAISTDRSQITVSEAVTDETENTGATFTGAGSVSYSYTSNQNVVFTNNAGTSTDTIQLTDSGGTAISGAFDDLSVGQQLVITNTATQNGTYTITAIDSANGRVTISEELPGVTVTDTDGADIDVFSVAGTVSATPYFAGDTRTLTHRVDDDRSFDLDFHGASPAIEKAIRAMSLILQGSFGSEGGLDKNPDRTGQAEYLLEASLERTVSGTPPFGTELDGSIEQLQIDIGFDRVLIDTTNKLHKDFIGFLDTSIIDLENVNLTETLSLLLDDQRALEASFQIFARVRDLSLTNFI